MIRRLVKPIYNRLFRPHLPRKLGAFNGVPVRQPRLFDRTDVRPDYEGALISGINEQVQAGDNVVVVGGGWGVGSVHAARNASSNGNVTVFEGGSQQVERVNETANLSGISDRISVRHAVVGIDEHVYGDARDAKTIPPTEIPSCDVLVLDCEGAETTILDGLKIQPRAIVVETHHMYNAPAEDVRDILDSLGYDVTAEYIEKSTYGDLPILSARDTTQN